MAATISATLKGESSNSYATLAEANSYFETSPDDSTWTNKSDDQKNRALIAACRWIDSLGFYGDRCSEEQALKWPRYNYHVDDVELACTEIPETIKYAQYELARALANDPDSMTGNKGTEGVAKEVEMGELKVKYTDNSLAMGGINNVLKVYPWLQSYLGAYITGGTGSHQIRVIRN